MTRQIALLSGKGGTGKTSLCAAFARLAGTAMTVDADVEAANLALIMPGADEPARTFVAGRRAMVDDARCSSCGACLDACRFEALETQDDRVRVDPLRCEGCGACALACPAEAVSLWPREAGSWTIRHTRFGPLIHARLAVGQGNSGKLVSRVRDEARATARRTGLDLILVDGPPGIGCPVHAAVAGVDLVIGVTEPSAAGAHDLRRLLDLCDHFAVGAAVVLNKADLHPRLAAAVEELCTRRRVPLVGRLPFDPAVPRALASGRSLLAVPAVGAAVVDAWAATQTLWSSAPRAEAHGA